MRAEQRGDLLLLQKQRRLHVRGDHAFLDQLVRVVALGGAHRLDAAGLVEAKLHFRRLEIDRTAAFALLRHRLVQRVQVFQLRQHVGHFMAGIGLLETDRLPHLVVGEPGVRQHHRVVELRLGDVAFGIDQHVADHAHPLDFRHQRTDAVGQGLRQHRHHEAGEIGRGAALVGFAIQRIADLYIVRDIGDRHDQPPAATALRFGIHRVIEVARIGAIDRHQRQLADVGAAFAFGRGHHGFHLRRIAQHLGRPFVRQVVAGNRHLHHQRWLQALAQYRADLTHRAAL